MIITVKVKIQWSMGQEEFCNGLQLASSMGGRRQVVDDTVSMVQVQYKRKRMGKTKVESARKM